MDFDLSFLSCLCQWACWVGRVLEYIIAIGSHEALVMFASLVYVSWGFPGGSDCKGSAGIVGDPGLIPGSGRSPGEGKDYPLQYSRLENSVDRGAWRATVHGVTELDMLNDYHFFTYFHMHHSYETENRATGISLLYFRLSVINYL